MMNQTVLDGYDDTIVYLFEEQRKVIDFQIVLVWVNVGPITMFVEQASSEERLIAAQLGINIVYTVMWNKQTSLKFNDKLAFRDLQGNIIYIRIATEPLKNRSESFSNIMQATAEIWIPPAEVKKDGLPI